ncbi:MAG: GNAT family N-acetyltransferase [Terriglobales bacterium]
MADNLSLPQPFSVGSVVDRSMETDPQVNIHVVDPLADRRWDELVAQHPKASVFHKRGWLKALQLTYGYKPFVLTSAAPGEAMKDGMAFCRVSSWVTGARAVSLPFADHCEPLVSSAEEVAGFSEWMQSERGHQRWKYVELRPLWPFEHVNSGLQPSSSYCFHELDIQPNLEHIFHGMHRGCIQRKIRRAEREGLSYEVGRSSELLDAFYRLLLITRRRLRILPQPRSWFRNLLECAGDDLQIRVARKNGIPIASVLTLRHRRSVFYKYGCSHERFHNLGAMPFLFWKMIEESKAWGAETIDFGRSDLRSDGLIKFKDRLGASKHTLTYYRYPSCRKPVAKRWESETARHIVALLPDMICGTAGRILYRHVG